jgi:hypothetical protein
MDGTTKTTAPEKLLRCALALLLLCATLVTGTATAQAKTGRVEVTIGEEIPYAGYNTTYMEAGGNIAYCADPTSPTPNAGSYSTEGASDDVEAAIWASWGAPGFDRSLFPGEWYDGSGWDDGKYLVASHILISYAHSGSKSQATYGTSQDFASWADDELLGSTWGKVEALKGKVPSAFDAFTISTGSASQTLVSFTYDSGGLKVAKADSQAGDAPQGDGALAGARFEVVNATGAYTYVGGKYYANGEAVATIESQWDESAGKYVASTGNRALPAGKYEVREALAPEGYSKAADVKKATVGNGEVSDLTGDAFEDDVIRGGVQVTKSDKELGASEALGGDSHGAEDTGSTLGGIEFTIANASAAKVYVDGKWFKPGDEIETITTAWNEEARAYTAQTASDELPYGTYTVQETKTNGSYLLTDGEPKIFQVREGGKVVDATADGGALEFRDQVVRNDLELVKMAEDTNASLQVAFKVTNLATGEAHVLATDANGNASTASSWNKHSSNTNGNDSLLEADTVKASDIDPKAGIWFGLGEDGGTAAVDDDLAALPYGKYELEELRSDTNEGYELVKKTFTIERDSGAAKAVWMSLDDKQGPKIQTEETDKADGDHVAQASDETTLVDTVWYENLKTDGTEYTLTGTLMVKSTGEPLKDAEGNEITAAKTFKPKAASGQVELEFTFDSSLLAGEDVVAFESLESEGVEVAAHADIEDGDQTVHFLSIHTTATDKSDGDKLVTGSEAVVSDEVAFEGLVPGTEYVLDAALMDAETGEAVLSEDGAEITGTATFTPEAEDGTQTVELAFDASGLGGKRLVVFEKLLSGDVQLASHEDAGDEGQTVTACEIGTKLADAADGDQVVTIGKVELTDTVEYKGLIAGDKYTVHGTIMVKSTGEALADADGNPVTATAEFTAEASEGTVEVSFAFDASSLGEGDELVAFEEVLTAQGNLAAAHQDIDDAGQTVVIDNPDTPEVPESPYDKTGAATPEVLPFALAGMLIIAAGSVTLVFTLKRRRKDGEAETSEEVAK